MWNYVDHNVNENVVRLKLFPFSLKDKAKMWLNTLEPKVNRDVERNANKVFKEILPSQ